MIRDDTVTNLKTYRWKHLNPPIKEKRVCVNCGRKKTFTYTFKDPSGGLWTKDSKPCLPYMLCPRCKNATMIEAKEDEKERN